jgi:hypothetical protein
MAKDVKATKEGKRSDINVIQLKSVDSPYFPKDEFERQRQLLDPRRFAMKYEGVFGDMQGLVFDTLNLCQSMPLPAGTKYYAALDWGYNPDPFALVIRAVTPDKIHYRVGEYYKNFLTISDICQIVKARHQLFNFQAVVCDPSQPANIQELCNKGIPAMGANNEIRYGIDKHYALIQDKRFWIFEDMNQYGIDEYKTYHYPEEKELKPDEDSKERLPVDKSNHGIDCDRYLSLFLETTTERILTPKVQVDNQSMPKDNEGRLRWLKRGGHRQYDNVM